MMKYLFAAGLVVVSASCGMFKNTENSNSKSRQQSSYELNHSISEEKDWLSKSGSLTFYVDSTNQDYTIQLWPVGRFSYSPEKGFTGEAQRILITDKSKSGSAYAGMSNTEESDKGKVDIQVSAKEQAESTEQQKTKKSSVSWKVILAV
ncbi:MAG: hypothetical protein MUP99_09985, partial [Pedobacter sp.]|nr:hypothetical protein [Pedobacter sp.]